MKVGFIGTGNMGRRMAKHVLRAGHDLAVHDVQRDAAAELIEAGARWADTVADLARQCDVICSSLPGPADVESVVLGPGGLLENGRAGLLFVDHTTSAPLSVRKLHEQLKAREIAMLDAPVSGGVGGAEAGTLTMLVGGEADALERARPVLSTMAANIIYAGASGAGTICKLMHNCAVFSANLAMIECLTLGVKAGVDANVLVEVFQKSGIGRNLDLQVAMPATLFRGNFNPRFSLKMAHKDMKLATDLAHSYNFPLPLASVCERDMDEAMARGWGDRDNTVFLTLQEERAGVEVRTSTGQAG